MKKNEYKKECPGINQNIDSKKKNNKTYNYILKKDVKKTKIKSKNEDKFE